MILRLVSALDKGIDATVLGKMPEINIMIIRFFTNTGMFHDMLNGCTNSTVLIHKIHIFIHVKHKPNLSVLAFNRLFGENFVKQ